MPKQPAFPGLRDAMKKNRTRCEHFLAEMDAVVPWDRLLALVAVHYPKAGPKGGRTPMPLETMLRVHFLQNWYALSDPFAGPLHLLVESTGIKAEGEGSGTPASMAA